MLTPHDDYPVHQTALPLAQAGEGNPDFYDRFWFNGYTDELYFAVALGTYPNRGVIDAAFSVLYGGRQRSVFASGRLPLDRTRTRIGPIAIEVTEAMRVNRVTVDAPDHGLVADLTYRARTVAFEEPRQTLYDGPRLVMDVTRASQLGTWTGELAVAGERIRLGKPYGTKDRSWGIRPVGRPAPAAPAQRLPQIFFLWAPLHFPDECLHFIVFEDAEGHPWAKSAARLPVIGDGDPVYGVPVEPVHSADHSVRWAPGLRRSEGATLTLGGETVELEPLLTFRMRGAGYQHPTWAHGVWHDELAVGGEEFAADDLDSLDPASLHVQQVMRCTWGDRRGLGILEQLVIGPHHPSGFNDLFDGAPGAAPARPGGRPH